jgi:hypothetical protein
MKQKHAPDTVSLLPRPFDKEELPPPTDALLPPLNSSPADLLIEDPVVGGPLAKPSRSGLTSPADGAPSSQAAGRKQEEVALDLIAVIDTIAGQSSSRINGDHIPRFNVGATLPAEVRFCCRF